MSRVQFSRNLYPWLPYHLRALYKWLKLTDPTWGFTIYRTTYAPQSEAAFPAIVDLITAYIKDGFYKEYQALLEESIRANEDDIAVFDEMWAKYEPRMAQ